MLHKITAAVLGLLCLAPLYTLSQMTKPLRGNGGNGGGVDFPDVIVITVLAICGLGLLAIVIF